MKKILLLSLALAAITGVIVFAGLAVIYPVTGTVSEVKPPVVFVLGSNANAAGLWGTPLTVTLGTNQTSASLSLQATYGETYVKDILLINNTDTVNSYYVQLYVTSPLNSTKFTGADMLIDLNNDGVPDIVVNLLNTSISPVFLIPAASNVTVSFNFTIPEGVPLDTAPAAFQVSLHYSAENPPP